MALLGIVAPRFLAWPIAFLLFWLGMASLFRAWSGGASETDQEDGT